MKNQAGDVLISLAIAKLFKESGKNSITLSEEDFENFGGKAVKIVRFFNIQRTSRTRVGAY